MVGSGLPCAFFVLFFYRFVCGLPTVSDNQRKFFEKDYGTCLRSSKFEEDKTQYNAHVSALAVWHLRGSVVVEEPILLPYQGPLYYDISID